MQSRSLVPLTTLQLSLFYATAANNPAIPPPAPMPTDADNTVATLEQPPAASSSTTTPTATEDSNLLSTQQSRSSQDAGSYSCQWVDCDKVMPDPETLYNHLCNDHIGRKSTGNLCLTCKWKDCGTTCAKRDHITSHLRGKHHVH